jgi:HAD superfamily hydrolase (TIGR01509 family)
MKLKALIFDVDGTIADTEDVHRQAFNAAFAEMEFSWNWDAPTYVELLKISSGPDRLARYIEDLKVQTEERQRLLAQIPAIHRVKSRLYLEMISAGHAPIRTGVVRLIHEARTAGLRVAAAATSSTSNIEALVSSSLGREALGWFAVIASVDQVPNRKPAPDIYLRVASQLRVSPQECVVFEDSANGVRAARAAGMVTIATPSRWTATQDFSSANMSLYSLGDPSDPLDEITSRSLGVSQLGLTQVAELHARVLQAS